MKYNTLYDFIIDKWIDILALVISIVALCFSYYVYERRQHQIMEDKQIDAVVGLVDYIQECKLSLLFTPEPINREKKELQFYSFFELADTTIRSDMDQAPIYFPADEKLPIDFSPYVNNPLIPSEIAIKLRDYYLHDVQYQSSYDAIMMANVLITKFNMPESMKMDSLNFQKKILNKYALDSIRLDFGDQFVTMRHVPALRTFGRLKSKNKELYGIIVKWFHDKGMDNVNIPMDSKVYEKRKYIR